MPEDVPRCPPRALRPLPPEEARSIADALEAAAWDLAKDVEFNEPLVRQLDGFNGIAADFEKLRRRAELVGLAHLYFKELAERPETPVVFDRRHYLRPSR